MIKDALSHTRHKNCSDDEIHFLIAHLSLYSGDGNTPLDVDNPQSPGNQQASGRLLYGTLVSSPQIYRNLQGRTGHYFIFPDVSIRYRGRYQLKITLMRLSRRVTVRFFRACAFSSTNNYRIGASGVVGVGEQGGALATARTRPFDIVSQNNYAAPRTWFAHADIDPFAAHS